MPTRHNGAFKLFRIGGIDVYLHFTWFLIAYYQISINRSYHEQSWKVFEYLTIFLIVLLHEFGHAFACRSTGGTANEIVLWPLGGVAYVAPPPRPGAQLWSLAAGPLVNVALLPVFFGFYFLVAHGFFGNVPDDMLQFAEHIAIINLVILCFNLLPCYPLDGGQIFRSLLWFVIGPIRSLYVATVIGMAGAVGLALYALDSGYGWWGVVMCLFILSQSINGFKQARGMSELARAPRHPGFACPSCKAAPLIGNFWKCGHCARQFDTFETNATCPGCGAHFKETRCVECKTLSPMEAWRTTMPR